MPYDENYYELNAQDRDRPALHFYTRIWKRYMKSDSVLDFGCGVGFFSNRLTRECENVYSFELQKFAREQAIENAPKAKIINSLSELKSDSINSIVALHVLEHISDNDLEQIGQEFHRILNCDGRLLFVMPNLGGNANLLKGERWSAFSDKTHINLKSSSEWESYFQNQWRLEVIEVFADGYYDFPYSSGWRRLLDLCRLFETGLQFILGRGILQRDNGENVVFVLQKL